MSHADTGMAAVRWPIANRPATFETGSSDIRGSTRGTSDSPYIRRASNWSFALNTPPVGSPGLGAPPLLAGAVAAHPAARPRHIASNGTCRPTIRTEYGD